MRKYMILLICIFILVGCESEKSKNGLPVEAYEELRTEITLVMNQKLQAIQEIDYDLYIATISSENQYYFNEQSLWFKEMTKPLISDVKLEVESIEVIDETTLVATIHQSHQTLESFDFEYPLSFVLENDRWLDTGYHFYVFETEKFTVKFMDGDERVDEFIGYLDYAYNRLDFLFDEKPDEQYELKLFRDKEMLRQRTVPSIAWQFVGWAATDGSLKIYTGENGNYAGVMQHELVHHITLKMCNNNMPTWITEGIAMMYGDMDYKYTINREDFKLDLSKLDKDILYLETVDLYNVATEEVGDFYNTSYLYVLYIVETYGKDTLMAMFYEAGKKPFNSSVFNENYEQDNIDTMTEVMETVLGITKEELSIDYLNWIESLKKKSSSNELDFYMRYFSIISSSNSIPRPGPFGTYK